MDRGMQRSPTTKTSNTLQTKSIFTRMGVSYISCASLDKTHEHVLAIWQANRQSISCLLLNVLFAICGSQMRKLRWRSPGSTRRLPLGEGGGAAVPRKWLTCARRGGGIGEAVELAQH
eukprot:scaffold225136_cov39-Tisochrysis_lutea.AAC.1